MLKEINVIGAGLAGSEAAYQIAKRGIKVNLYEMRPKKMTPAHHGKLFGELVCSNSLKSMSIENASGLLKEEMKELGSLIIEAAYASQVQSGQALSVDREQFATYITNKITSNPLINVIYEEITEIPSGTTIIALDFSLVMFTLLNGTVISMQGSFSRL